MVIVDKDDWSKFFTEFFFFFSIVAVKNSKNGFIV